MVGTAMYGYPDTIGFSILGDVLGHGLRGDWVHWHVALGQPLGAGLVDPTCGYWHGLEAANEAGPHAEQDQGE